jgi:hypothetical protein
MTLNGDAFVDAEQVGISEAAFERLLRGDVPEAVAQRIGGTTAQALQRFVDGGISTGLATRLKCSEPAIQQLRDALGRPGAIGLLLGLCVPRRENVRRG